MTRRLRAAWRLVASAAHVLHGVAIAVLRLRSLGAAQRDETVRWWAAKALRSMGVTLQFDGAPPRGAALVVANHVSWLDILALHAVCPKARFVSKADVTKWPVLATLIDAGGTLYLQREHKRDALRVVQAMAAALAAGDVVAIFPEGTTSDGRGLLPFHANLLQAAIASGAAVQPVALRYADSSGPRSRAVEFIGATTLAQSLWRVACGDGLTVHVTLLPPRHGAGADRRSLARLLRDDIAVALGAG